MFRQGRTTNSLITASVLAMTTQGGQQNQNQNQSPTPPTAPTNVVAVSAPSSAVVSWSPIFSNSSAVSSYVVSVVGSSVPGCTLLIELGAQGGGQPRCTVSGLRNGTGYQFTVVARNAAGDSPASVASASVVPAAVPMAPTLVRASASSEAATVAWTSRFNNGAAITSFTVTTVEEPNLRCLSSSLVALPARSCVVRGLTNGRDYTFTVVATNAAGNSLASAPSDSVRVAGAPAAPVDLVAVAGDRSATISWSTPASNGRPITSYSVRTAQGPWKTCTYVVPDSGSATNTCTVTGLINGNTYAFIATATNAVGTSVGSSPTSPVIAAAVPSAPLSVTAVLNGTTAPVQWSASEPNGRPVTSYVVTADQDPAKTCTAVAVQGILRRTCSITALEYASGYTFTVVAVSEAGRSVASAPSNEVRPVKVPDAPTSVTARAEDGAVTISWVDSVTYGVPVTSYVVNAVSNASKTCTLSPPFGISRSCRIDGLTNGVSQQFTVVANSALGASATSAAPCH